MQILQLKKKRCRTEISTHAGAGAADTHNPDSLLALLSKYYPEGFHKFKKYTVLFKKKNCNSYIGALVSSIKKHLNIYFKYTFSTN